MVNDPVVQSDTLWYKMVQWYKYRWYIGGTLVQRYNIGTNIAWYIGTSRHVGLSVFSSSSSSPLLSFLLLLVSK